VPISAICRTPLRYVQQMTGTHIKIIPMVIYSKQENKVTENSKPNTIFAIIISQGSIAFILGKVFALPLIVIGLFPFSKKSRNWKSRFNILFYTGLVILIGSPGKIKSQDLTISHNLQYGLFKN